MRGGGATWATWRPWHETPWVGGMQCGGPDVRRLGRGRGEEEAEGGAHAVPRWGLLAGWLPPSSSPLTPPPPPPPPPPHLATLLRFNSHPSLASQPASQQYASQPASPAASKLAICAACTLLTRNRKRNSFSFSLPALKNKTCPPARPPDLQSPRRAGADAAVQRGAGGALGGGDGADQRPRAHRDPRAHLPPRLHRLRHPGGWGGGGGGCTGVINIRSPTFALHCAPPPLQLPLPPAHCPPPPRAPAAAPTSGGQEQLGDAPPHPPTPFLRAAGGQEERDDQHQGGG